MTEEVKEEIIKTTTKKRKSSVSSKGSDRKEENSFTLSEDFRLIDKIQKETNIERLKNLFIQAIHSYEAQLVGLQESNESQIEVLQMQLSDSNASVNALNLQIKKLKEMQESELEKAHENEKLLQDALKEARSQTSTMFEKSQLSSVQEFDSEATKSMQEKIESLNTENVILKNQVNTLQMRNKALLVAVGTFKQQLENIKASKDDLIQVISKFYSTTKKSIRASKEISYHTLELLRDSKIRSQELYNGLYHCKEMIQSLRAEIPPRPEFNLRAYKMSTERIIANYIAENQSQFLDQIKTTQKKYKSNLKMKITEQKNSLSSLKALCLSTSSAFRLFVQGFQRNFQILRETTMHSINTVDLRVEFNKQRENKKTKQVQRDLKQAQTQIALLTKQIEINREKRRNEKLKQKENNFYSRSSSRMSVSSQPAQTSATLVSVGTLAHILTPHLDTMRERTKRASKEAEISVLTADIRRKEERINTLESQISGLRRIIKHTEENADEESGKTKQQIFELEEQLRNEKSQTQKKSASIQKLQKSLDDSQKQAKMVEPLTTTISRIFKSCSEKLEPLLSEQAISPELTELDELSKQFFNVPIHKICAPQFSRAYLKKQEHRFNTALQNRDVEEMVVIMDGMFEEFAKNKSQNSNLL
ncbi:hypothetical protein TVAG_392440 [Trichomonas vaginalis G3]|uniref:Uncharacterized protein n=1 Tax=Trichomonas vaginalis (strain ATCC PRA-98 / G3) TaxID=412133 RepID=A2DWU5_TRIV3|nr:hypothetical protein TVAGG3_0839430 [Trichomonas vaginalis G3]EAY15127.1 hypothetical protein TVAG_392440 [Trichomonas vaginalis G3]KAI5499181.1 hypothetical protein TVAGG3_0839430 [Trichomonas vaginalis G3]|eukprot:XP_001327350.1 hypothetical protein [Trichomonas vaginalis G3]